ncbi:hypothetical protein [Micromonospora sp. CB01531]|uniref:hypothetical protein n=1 Tax=Micromonospora sp. CB01531 TaxID=1718947 RepID=UPI00116139FC|nr:hypothetical protein [Micromonospora sp. CB01531]
MSGFLLPLGGVAGLEASCPQSAPAFLRQLAGRYGAAAVQRLRAADARVLAAVRAAEAVRNLLVKEQLRMSPRTAEVGFLALDRQITAHELSYADVLTVLALGDDDRPAGGLDEVEPPPAALAVLGEMLWSSAYAEPQRRVAALVRGATDAQELADAYVEVGRQLTGVVVARHEGDDEDVRAGAVLAPLAGCLDEEQAIAQARLTGVATAVLRATAVVPRIHYTCALSTNLTYADVLSGTGPARTDLTTQGADARVVALTTAEGHVLRAGGGRYFCLAGMPHRAPWLSAEYPDHDPGVWLRADLRLAELHARGDDAWDGDVYRPDLPLGALFTQTALDYTLARLMLAERTLDAQRRRFKPTDAPLPLPEPGGALRAKTAELRPLLHEAALLAWVLGDREPTEAESRSAQRLTARIGEIAAAEPLAPLFITIDRDEDEAPELGEFTDELAGGLDGDASRKVLAALDERLDNVAKLRGYLLSAHPVAARRLAPVHPDVIEAFTDEQRRMIGLVLLVGQLRDLAGELGMELANVLLLVLGLVEPPVALAAGSLSAAIGAVGVVQGFQQAELLAVMAALDAPGGFQLAAAEDAAEARTAAWRGLALSLVDFLLLGADVGRQLRRAAIGRAATSPLAAQIAADSVRVPFLRAIPAPAAVAAALPGAASAGAKVSELAAAAELANKQRLSSRAFKSLSSELRMSQRSLRNLIISAVDEVRRAEAVLLLRKAARNLLEGGAAKSVPATSVLKGARKAVTSIAPRSVREYLVVGAADPEIGWGLEQLAAGRRTTVVAPARNAGVDAVVAGNGRFVQGGVTDLPAGYQCTVAREELLNPAQLPDPVTFVTQRVDRLRQGGQWVVVTESPAFARSLAGVAPRSGVRIWTTEYTTIRNGVAVPRHVVVVARPRPTTMTAITALIQPPGLTPARVTGYLQTLLSPANLPRLQRKLTELWHQGMIEAGQVPDWVLRNLTGNIGEILADGYKDRVLRGRLVGESAAKLQSGVRRIDGVTEMSKEFTDDLITVERNGNLIVLDVFEIKAGPRGGQEGISQLFEWMENELEVGDRIAVGGREFVYDPAATGRGRIIGLSGARRHLVVAKGAETAGRRSADQVAAEVITETLDLSAAEIRHLARRIIEGLPPVP